MNNRNASLLPRRSFLMGVAAAGASLGLAGCGFELRKAPVFAFKTLSVSGNSELIKRLRREMRAAGTVTLGPAAEAQSADAILDILGEKRERFPRRRPGGKRQQPPTAVSQTRDLSFNATTARATEGVAEPL